MIHSSATVKNKLRAAEGKHKYRQRLQQPDEIARFCRQFRECLIQYIDDPRIFEDEFPPGIFGRQFTIDNHGNHEDLKSKESGQGHSCHFF